MDAGGVAVPARTTRNVKTANAFVFPTAGDSPVVRTDVGEVAAAVMAVVSVTRANASAHRIVPAKIAETMDVEISVAAVVKTNIAMMPVHVS